jgi:general nucleoside transport system permease protein
MSINVLALIGAMLTIATPLVWAGIGEVIVEKTGILNLGIEGTMYLGAFIGFLAALRTGSPWLGLLAAIVSGVVAGLLMGLFTVTLGLNQHVSGLGLTLLLIASCEFTFRLLYAGERPTLSAKFDTLLPGVSVLNQHWLTYVAFLVLAPVACGSCDRPGWATGCMR